MPAIDLSDDERRELARTLQRVLSDLSVEIADTDRQDYRNDLKARRDTLTAILQKLGEPRSD